MLWKETKHYPYLYPYYRGLLLETVYFPNHCRKMTWEKRYRRKNILRFYQEFIHFMFVIFVRTCRALSLCRYLVCEVETVLSFSDLSTELTTEVWKTLCFYNTSVKVILPLKHHVTYQETCGLYLVLLHVTWHVLLLLHSQAYTVSFEAENCVLFIKINVI